MEQLDDYFSTGNCYVTFLMPPKVLHWHSLSKIKTSYQYQWEVG